MLFSRVVSILAFFVTFGAVVLAKPISAVDPLGDATSVESVLATLKSKTDVIWPEIKNATEGHVSDDNVELLVLELVLAVTTAKSSIGSIGTKPSAASYGAIAELVAEQIEKMVESLGTAADVSGFLTGLDITVSEFVIGLDIIAVGTATLTSVLVSGLVAPLNTLQMVQTIKVLNL